MLDIKWIRENTETVDKVMEMRGAKPVSDTLVELDSRRRKVMAELQGLQSERNRLSKEIGQAKSSGADAAPLFEKMKNVGPQVKNLEEQERALQIELKEFVETLPNMLDSDVPIGKNEDDNVEVSKWGTPKEFDFEVQAHYDLGEKLGLLDFEVAAKISGSRFAWLQGDLARLERALGNFMLNQHIEKGFTEIAPPLLINPESMYGTGQYPKFEEDAFITNDERNLALSPTSEVAMTNYARGEVFSKSRLPFLFTAFCPNFRKEAGSAGRDTRGYIRQHQFSKVEMVQIVQPEKSDEALKFMLNCAENVLQKLKLPYRVLNLCSGDIGFAAMKTYDLEVWLPAQGTYREISSCSNCGDFQARRMNAKFKDENGKNHFVHTLNGTGVATGRALVAVMENYQNADGSINIPEVLQPYMGGKQIIKAVK